MKTFIGIDPGVSTGFAVWRPQNKHYELATLSFWECYSRLILWHISLDKELHVYIENPNLNKPVFSRGVSAAAQIKIAQNVGANKRDAQLWIEFCEFYGIQYSEVRPTKSKQSPAEFAKMWGISKPCSQHARDAFDLIGGRA